MSLLDWDPPTHRMTNVAPPLSWWWPPRSDRAHAVLPDGSTACGHPRRDARWTPGAHAPRCYICGWTERRGGVL